MPIVITRLALKGEGEGEKRKKQVSDVLYHIACILL
jgi:hypothetical protein